MSESDLSLRLCVDFIFLENVLQDSCQWCSKVRIIHRLVALLLVALGLARECPPLFFFDSQGKHLESILYLDLGFRSRMVCMFSSRSTSAILSSIEARSPATSARREDIFISSSRIDWCIFCPSATLSSSLGEGEEGRRLEKGMLCLRYSRPVREIGHSMAVLL